jgi:hypothetical protein
MENVEDFNKDTKATINCAIKKYKGSLLAASKLGE